ncbi:MAG TPA: hypothetical protein VFV78_10155 [Vicinamibacterales bacterium]|nr:hypothetical protein [Vicinamibacterales bacterium]
MTCSRLLPFLFAGLLWLNAAGPCFGQTQTDHPPSSGLGERYWVELTATWWKPGLDGAVSSDRLGLIGSRVDFVTDLAFENTSHQDVRVVVHPARKHKFKFQYSHLTFGGDSILARDITFKGQLFPIALPLQSELTWNVMRLGYEWDFFYRPRGYVGMLLEVRQTDLSAALTSLLASGEIAGNAPIPSLGLAGRVYPIRQLAINLEGSFMKLSDLDPDHVFQSFDFEVSGTYNFHRTAGISAGWRRMNTNLVLDGDRGDLNFAGVWIGGVVRY